MLISVFTIPWPGLSFYLLWESSNLSRSWSFLARQGLGFSYLRLASFFVGLLLDFSDWFLKKKLILDWFANIQNYLVIFLHPCSALLFVAGYRSRKWLKRQEQKNQLLCLGMVNHRLRKGFSVFVSSQVRSGENFSQSTGIQSKLKL